MYCRASRCHEVKRKGFYERATGRSKRVQRYFCRDCCRTFSRQSSSNFRGERKSHVNQRLARLLCAGVSQRRCAIELNISRTTVSRKIQRLGLVARLKITTSRKREGGQVKTVVFDEMESFEHTKCKPLSIALAVDKESRRILAVRVARMPAKGLLAHTARRKYGFRKDDRPKSMARMMRILKKNCPAVEKFLSDECPRYPTYLERFFPSSVHVKYKGRRGCVVGQGELKRGGFDPLFSLNHTAAMYRDNLKRLARKTWCTTKDPNRLQDLMDLYSYHHNEIVKKGWHRVRI